MKKHYNIMTSSDGNLIKQIEILMYSISVNLSDAEIDFYNFMMGWYNVFDKGPSFKPAIVHFVGNVKPWQVRYAYELEWFKDRGKNKRDR